MTDNNTKRDNFRRALVRLKEAVAVWEARKDDALVRDGMIQRFEFTFELAWKAAKEALANVGIAEARSPKTVLQEAYSLRWIEDEGRWLQMLRDRNQTTHLYDEAVAEAIAQRIAQQYAAAFEALLQRMEKDHL